MCAMPKPKLNAELATRPLNDFTRLRLNIQNYGRDDFARMTLEKRAKGGGWYETKTNVLLRSDDLNWLIAELQRVRDILEVRNQNDLTNRK